jgi:hypothetical protein
METATPNQPKGEQQMTTATATEKKQDKEQATAILESVRGSIEDRTALVQISTEYGKGTTDYLRVSVFHNDSNGQITQSHLTWAIAKALGYSLRDRNGRWYLALNGGGYSKSYDVALSLTRFYGIEHLRYDDN